MKKFLTILASSALFTAGWPLNAGETGELSRFVDSALRRNPGLRAAESQVRAARQARAAVRAQSLPLLRAESLFTRGDNPVYVFGTLLQQQSFQARHFDVGFLNNPGDLSNVRTSLEIGVPLFTGFALQSGRKMSGLGLRQAELSRDAAAQGVRYGVLEAYLTALLKERQLTSLRERIASSEKEVEDAKRLRAKGLVLGSDYFAAEALLEGLRVWQAQVSAEKDAALARLRVLTGEEPSPSPSRTLGETVYSPPSEEELVDQALKGRNDVRAAALQAESAGVARKMETSGLLPRVEAFGSVAANTRDFSTNPSDHLWGVRAGLSFGDPSYPARRAGARSAWEAAKAGAAQAEENARIEALQALKGYEGAAEALPPSKRALENARKSLDMFRPLYREGRQSILDVLRAEEGLARAESNHWLTLYNAHVGYARLLLAAGRLDGEGVSDIERRLEVLP